MRTDQKIKDEKLQYDINKAALKIYRIEYLTKEEYYPHIEEAEFTYIPIVKALKKQVKAIEEHGKQMKRSH